MTGLVLTSTVLPTPSLTLKPLSRPTSEIPTPTLATTGSTPTQVTATGAAANPIVAENQQQGATDWQVDPGAAAKGELSQIAGFADAVSVDAGGSIHFAISTRTAGMS
jgi:hypothetical protein